MTATLSSCAADIVSLAPREFDAALHSDPTATLIDVRQPDEYAAAHIAGARLIDWLQPDTFAAAIKTLDPSRTYYVYCRSGRRSLDAARAMHDAGLKVVDLKGGILAWQDQQMPVTTDDN